MNFDKIKIPSASAIIFAMAVVLTVNCKRAGEGETNHDGIPSDVKQVALAIIEDSPEKFAGAMTYPIERPYPLKNIEDSAHMIAYYPTLVDDSLVNIVRESPDSSWVQEGWRGWTFVSGDWVWIDDGKAYAINYVSKRETEILDSLRNMEISTLEPHLRAGWIPVMCIVDTSYNVIFRIDTDTLSHNCRYRLAGYRSVDDLSGNPAIVLYGNLDEEGTINSRFYHFSDSVGNRADYSPDIVTENDSLPEMEIKRNGKLKKYRVKRDYWLDQYEKRKREQKHDTITAELATGIRLKTPK